MKLHVVMILSKGFAVCHIVSFVMVTGQSHTWYKLVEVARSGILGTEIQTWFNLFPLNTSGVLYCIEFVVEL